MTIDFLHRTPYIIFLMRNALINLFMTMLKQN